MASRAEKKAQARAERIEFERRLAEAARRKQRLARLAGVAIVAVVVIVAAVVISSSHKTTVVKPDSPAAKTADTSVDSLLAGIPESGNNVLGKPSAPVTVTEFGDLECSACDDFAVASGVENRLITDEVRPGKVQLVYRSLSTATTNGPDPSVFPTQQAAALAAGLQQRAWYYIELFYHEQGEEDTTYVTEDYLDGLAKQVPGLNYSKWIADRNDPSLTAQVQSDESAAQEAGYDQTPTVVVKGPKGQAAPIVGVPTWSQLQSRIKKVS